MSSDALAALLRSLLEGIATLPACTAERCPVAAARLQQLALAVGHRLAEQERSPSEHNRSLLHPNGELIGRSRCRHPEYSRYLINASPTLIPPWLVLCTAGDLLDVLRQHVAAVPAAAAIFQPRPEDLPRLLPSLLRDAETILARGAAQVRHACAVLTCCR